MRGFDINLDHNTGRIGIGVVVLAAACCILYLYNLGARGLKLYEVAVKTLVWSIVAAFAIVVAPAKSSSKPCESA